MGVRRMYARLTRKGLYQRYGAMIADISKHKSQWRVMLNPGYSVRVYSNVYQNGHSCLTGTFKSNLHDVDSWLARAQMCVCGYCRSNVVSHTINHPDTPLAHIAEYQAQIAHIAELAGKA